MNWIQSIDDAVFAWVQSHLQQPLVQYAARDITSLGGDTLTALFTIFITGALWVAGNPKKGAWFAGTMILTAALIVGLKLSFGRPCPLQPDPYQMGRMGDFPTIALTVHLPCFPSGHTTGSTVLYSLILFTIGDAKPWIGPRLCRWSTAWLLALPVVIGCTRIVLSSHWLSDVIVGYILGWGIVGVSRWFQGRMLG